MESFFLYTIHSNHTLKTQLLNNPDTFPSLHMPLQNSSLFLSFLSFFLNLSTWGDVVSIITTTTTTAAAAVAIVNCRATIEWKSF